MSKYKVSELINNQIVNERELAKKADLIINDLDVCFEVKYKNVNGVMLLTFPNHYFSLNQLETILKLAQELARLESIKQINSELSKGGLK